MEIFTVKMVYFTIQTSSNFLYAAHRNFHTGDFLLQINCKKNIHTMKKESLIEKFISCPITLLFLISKET